MTVKALSFVAESGTGKTTLLEKVISVLKEGGYKVGVIKHDPTLVAVASDKRLELDVPVLELNNAAMVADFIEEKFLK